MTFYEQISLSLFFLVSTQIVLAILLIKNHRKLMGVNIGPKIGTNIKTDHFYFKNDNFETDKVVIFIELGCISCEKVIKTLQKIKSDFNNICIITDGKSEEVNKWKMDKSIIVNIKTLGNNIINKYYNIISFPYYIKIRHNKVFEKGFLNETNIVRLYNEVEKLI